VTKILLVPALTNGPAFRHPRVAGGDLADITPTHPSPMAWGRASGFGTVGVSASRCSRGFVTAFSRHNTRVGLRSPRRVRQDGALSPSHRRPPPPWAPSTTRRPPAHWAAPGTWP